MRLRPKTFLTFLALFLLPLILISGFSYWAALRLERWRFAGDAAISQFSQRVTALLDQQEQELIRVARSQALVEFIQSREQRTNSNADALQSNLRSTIASLLNPQSHSAAIAGYDQNKHKIFFAERRSDELMIREKDFLPGQLQPDERIWTASGPFRSAVSTNPLRANVQLTAAVMPTDAKLLGAVVSEVELDSLLREAAGADWSDTSREIVVTDESGRVLYYSNPAMLRRQVTIFSSEGRLTGPTKIPGLDLFVHTLDRSPASLSAKRVGIVALLLSCALATLAAFLLAGFWEKRTRGIERVSAGVAAIARGDLNHRIEALSSDAIRPISDNLNLMTAQLREQIAREAEARQFQSFVRLSAMLTHDLKNAIEALSLIVSNMERHFDNEDFRADAMKSLNLATQNLRALVDRLTNPVTTLSGEYKRPQPVDLVPLLSRVIKLTAEPALGAQQIEMKLPHSLPALVDAERIEKVIENLVLNAVEAMAGSEGKLSIAAGTAEEGKVFFSVSDTGVGMSANFIEQQLFHPFATTKKRGVGLGLYTCREVVRANAGAIEVDSREGAGTTFRVVLPSAAIEKV
ncbi:MAG TPA: ATP-binding protein [Pyrinomonadaceae bacterium]|nr:ATP-binding protein [Pyrinomonadaceae bacterium]